MNKNGLRRLETKKGFTMVELLAVIVILGILTTISIVGIQSMMARAKEKYYESQEQSILAAARNFSEKNKQYLPKINGYVINIPLKKLVEAKYIDKVVDYSKKTCSEEDSFVQVFYYDNEYQYLPYLKCESWHSKEITNSQDVQIAFVFSGTAADAQLKYTIQDQTNGLATYYYTIYADDKLVYTSEKYIVNTKKIEKTINLSEYTPSEIKVIMTGISQKGLSNTNSQKHDFSAGDVTTQIQCGTVTGDSTSWITSGSRKISVACVQGTNGIKCARNTFTKEFTANGKTGTIKISDTEGNTKDCPVNVYIDAGKPEVNSVEVTTRASGYNSKNVKIKISANDTVSGLSQICYSYSNNTSSCVWKNVTGTSATAEWDVTLPKNDGSGQTQTVYGFAKDVAGNISQVKSKNYTLYTFCSQLGGYKCGKSSPSGNIGYYTDVDNVCNQPGTNNGWGLKLVDCPYFDKYFTSHQCSQKERRACPCDTWNSDPNTLAFSTSQRAPDCNSLYCNGDVCKPSYCFNTANRGNPNCHD